MRHSYCDSDSSLFTSHILPYGYIFYLSKFYEVVDTAIILAKGGKVKRGYLFKAVAILA